MNKPWLDHYDEGVPHSIGTYPSCTLVDRVAGHSRTRPDHTAIVFKHQRTTWKQLQQQSDALARSLSALGVKAGDRVAILLPNAPQFVIAELAAWKIGAIPAPQNPIYTDRELEQSLAATTPAAIVVLSMLYERIKAIQPRTTIRLVIATNIKEYLPAAMRLAFTVLKEKKEGHRAELRDGDLWLQDLIARGEGTLPPPHRPLGSDPAVILMSGGTTGTPKGVVSSHRALVATGVQLDAWFREALSGNASILLPLPLFHTYGGAGVQSLALYRGTPLILVPNPRDLTDLVQTIGREKPALLCAVPALFTAMLHHRDVVRGKIGFRSIRACFSGASALMAETKKRFEELTGGRIVEGYSLTEATMACCVNPFRGPNKHGSIGLPVSDVSIRIVDADFGLTELPPESVGEIVMSAPQLMTGYWNDPAATAQMLRRDADGNVWLYTGDLGYLDRDGYVFLVDRKKDLIKTNGFQVWPREIEEIIASHPAVAEVGVAGVPHARRGEVITAWVVPRPGCEGISTQMLRGFCMEQLAPYKVPARIEIRNELPKTAIGKVLRRALVAEAKEAAMAAT